MPNPTKQKHGQCVVRWKEPWLVGGNKVQKFHHLTNQKLLPSSATAVCRAIVVKVDVVNAFGMYS
ncbi:hypothetical protein FRX31_023360 [Thalictrum thalictroides]|uniref:Uncharacterized protein n=1 Tax=Thalictrum thalictroides TaxID=46969 RepID=A0A7J6VPM3_THATH|nr:hypothetical protein FRX31_023360 [Thalictrum thalictroides]